MIRAAIYCRCSTLEECQQEALLRQAAEARECVRHLNWSLEEEYIESKSGTSTCGREEYKRLFGDLLEDKFEVVVIKSQDRLMRNTKDWYLFADRLVTSGKKLYLYLEKKFYSQDDGLLTGIKAILAEEYSRELSRKINNAHKNRQKTGSSLMLTSNTYGYRKMADKSFTVIEEEAQVKRRMYELCAQGYGSRTIARMLSENGIRKRNETYFSDSDIRRMIRNPINKGTVVMNRKHYDFDTRKIIKNPEEQFFVYENRIPAIVSEELWRSANEAIDKRRSRREKGGTSICTGVNKGNYLFSSKLVCGLCGAPFYRTTRKGKQDKIREWKCRTYLEQGRKKEGRAGGCDNIHLKEAEILALLEQQWAEGMNDKKDEILFDLLRKWVRESIWESRKKTEETFEIRVKKIKRQQQILLDKYLEGIVDEELYKENQKKLVKKLEEEVKRKNQKKQWEGLMAGEQDLDKRLEEIDQFLKKNHCISKARTICMVENIEKIAVFPDHLEIRGNKSGYSSDSICL